MQLEGSEELGADPVPKAQIWQQPILDQCHCGLASKFEVELQFILPQSFATDHHDGSVVKDSSVETHHQIWEGWAAVVLAFSSCLLLHWHTFERHAIRSTYDVSQPLRFLRTYLTIGMDNLNDT